MANIELNERVRNYFEILQTISELEAEAEAIKDAVKAEMVEQGTEELEGAGWRATWHNTTTNRFDSSAFKKEHAELYAAFTKKTNSTRFTLNSIKPEAA